MGASPFPYFDAREKILQRQAAAAEALKQREFEAAEKEKDRKQRAEEFAKTFSLRERQAKLEEERFGLEKKRTKATIDYTKAMTQNLKDQKSKLMLDIGKEVTAGNIVRVEPETPGAYSIDGVWYRPAKPQEKTEQAIRQRRRLELAAEADWKIKAFSLAKTGAVPEEVAAVLPFVGEKIGLAILSSTMAASLSPSNMYQFVSSLTKKLETGKMTMDEVRNTLGIFRQVSEAATAQPGTIEYYKNRNRVLEFQVEKFEVLPKVSQLVFSMVSPSPKDPNYNKIIGSAVGELMRKGKITEREAGIFMHDLFEKTRITPGDFMDAVMGKMRFRFQGE